MAALAACGGGSGGAGDGGATIVVADSAVRLLGTSDSIGVVDDLEVLPDASVWVLNAIEPFFVGFAPDGGVIEAHGRQGGGPEEFGAPAGFVEGGLDGEAWVFDRRRHALIRVSGVGVGPSELALPSEEIPRGSVLGGMDLMSNLVRTARLGSEVVLPRRTSSGEVEASSYWRTIWNAELVALDPAAGSVRVLLALERVLPDHLAQLESLTGGFPPFPLWFRLWAVCSDREVWLYDRIRNELRGFTAAGAELDATALPSPHRTEVAPREFGRALFDLAAAYFAGEVTRDIAEMSTADSARILGEVVPNLDATPQQLAAILPRYVDFRCAKDGTKWLRPLDLEVGGLRGGPAWLRIASDGTTDEVRLPDRFDPYRFTADRIWGVRRDELDVATVAWVSVPATR